MLLLIIKSSRSRIPVPAPRGVMNDNTLNPNAQGSERIIINEGIYIGLSDKSNNSFQGKLLDISGEGVGILLENNCIDNTYSFKKGDLVKLKLLNHDFICKVCRFNNNTLGLAFNEISPKEMKLIMSIFTKFMEPVYKNNKMQIIL